MKKLSMVLMLLAGCLFLVQTASAQSLAEKKEIKKAEDYLKGDPQKEIDTQCGTKLNVTIDWNSFKGKITADSSFGHMSAAYYCENVLKGVKKVCEDADGKDAAKKAISKVVCKYDEAAIRDKLDRYGPSLALKNKELTAGYQSDTGNIDEEVSKWLMNNL